MSDNNGQLNSKLPPEKWSKIEEDFINYTGSIKDFVTDNELVYSTVYKHSRAGNWIKKRDDRRRDDLLAGKVAFDEKVNETLDRALLIIEDNMDSKNVTGMIKTLESIVNTRYRIMDIPLPKQRIEDVTDTKAPADEFEERVKEQLQKIQQGVDDE